MVVAVQIWKGKVAYVMFKRPVGQPFTMEKQKLVMGINGDWQFKSNGDGHAWFCKSAVAAYLHGQNVMALQTAEYYKAHGAAEAVKDAPSAK